MAQLSLRVLTQHKDVLPFSARQVIENTRKEKSHFSFRLREMIGTVVSGWKLTLPVLIASLTLPLHSEADKETKKSATDTIKLESTFVGDKEQPAISYFIPWQGIGTPDKLHWNVEERHDNTLDTVDREVLLRSIQLYQEMRLEQP